MLQCFLFQNGGFMNGIGKIKMTIPCLGPD